MTNTSKKKSKKKTSRLGHDPLDFLSEGQDEDPGSAEINDSSEESSLKPAETEVEPTSNEDAPEQDKKISEQPSEEIEAAIEVTESENNPSIRLPTTFSIYEVNDVSVQMKARLDSDQTTIEIQGGDVEHIDAAALQLLVSFESEARELGKTINWQSCSDVIKDVAGQLSIDL